MQEREKKSMWKQNQKFDQPTENRTVTEAKISGCQHGLNKRISFYEKWQE